MLNKEHVRSQDLQMSDISRIVFYLMDQYVFIERAHFYKTALLVLASEASICLGV